MHESVARLEALLDRVLSFDQHAPAEKSATDSVEIAPLLQEIVDEYALAAQIKGLQLVVSAAAGLLVVGNIVRLHRALQEVVDNAVRYSSAGQVTLVATLQDGLVRISVADQGPGIPSEERDGLFAAFFRGRSTRALAETPGAGLGLSIARRDIETLGGRIWLEHSDARGSVICVAIPASDILDDATRNGYAQERVVGA
jgi:signal transduction histidine kinase